MKIKFLERNKKLIALMFCSFCLVNPVFAQPADELFQKGVAEYRKGHIQECLLIMKSLERKDPSNAYVEYYLAMSQSKLGHLEEAKAKYEKVVLLNQDSQLVSYSREGIKNIEKVQGKDSLSEVKEKKESKFLDKPFFKSEDEPEKTQKKVVSDEEIAKAIKVLRDAGLLNVQVGVNGSNPLALNNTTPEMMQQNAEMMNMNMLMSSMGGGSKGGMDMMPLLMMQQQGANVGKSNISPEMIQMMMNNSMLEGLSTFDTNNKDK